MKSGSCLHERIPRTRALRSEAAERRFLRLRQSRPLYHEGGGLTRRDIAIASPQGPEGTRFDDFELTTSGQVRLPAEFKHIIKRRKRN